MKAHDESDRKLAAALDAYRAAAQAEADAHFDEQALDAQRHRILQRLALAGQPARVLPFPGVAGTVRPTAGLSRRWISAAAVAGLVIGLISGELLHVMPGDAWVHRTTASRVRPAPDPVAGIRPMLVTNTEDPDNALLDAIDVAVTTYGASDLRALDDLTFAYDPR